MGHLLPSWESIITRIQYLVFLKCHGKKCRYIFDHVAGLWKERTRKKRKKHDILHLDLKGIRTWSYTKRDKSVRGGWVSSWIALCKTVSHQHPLASNPISPRWWALLFIFDFIKYHQANSWINPVSAVTEVSYINDRWQDE